MIARHLVIHGRVQGVWYRAWTVETARRLGLTGWVRNRKDGSVEAVVQGDGDVIAHFEELAQEGPPAAQVARVDATDVPLKRLDGFEKRPTA